jgi:hypothetical protein
LCSSADRDLKLGIRESLRGFLKGATTQSKMTLSITTLRVIALQLVKINITTPSTAPFSTLILGITMKQFGII